MKKREEIERREMEKNPGVVSTLLAKERTLLAKQRTSIALAQLGLGLVGFGLLVIRFFTEGDYEWFLWIGLVFVAASACIFYHAFMLYRKYKKKLERLHNMRGHLDMVYVKELETDF
jgi:uncharacterized membrane protein YidH (DUF202 family)